MSDPVILPYTQTKHPFRIVGSGVSVFADVAFLKAVYRTNEELILRSFAIVPKIWYNTDSNRGSLP